MNQEHNFWVRMLLKDKSDPLGFRWWLQPESSLVKSCANHWKPSNGNAHQYLFHQKSLPLRSAAEFPLPPSLLSGMLPSGLLHTQTAITWSDGKQKRIVIFLPCAILQNLFPILCISCGRRGEHRFVNGVTVLNSGTEASQKKTQQLVNLWLWVHYRWTPTP